MYEGMCLLKRKKEVVTSKSNQILFILSLILKKFLKVRKTRKTLQKNIVTFELYM